MKCVSCVESGYEKINDVVPGENECAYHIAGQPKMAENVILRLVEEASRLEKSAIKGCGVITPKV